MVSGGWVSLTSANAPAKFDVDESFFFAASAWTGDTGYRNGYIRPGIFQRAFRHRPGNPFTHGAVGLNHTKRNLQMFIFCLVGISDETAFEDIGRTGYFRECRSDQPARTRFRCRQFQSERSGPVKQP